MDPVRLAFSSTVRFVAQVITGTCAICVTASVKVEHLPDGMLIRDIPAMKMVQVVVSRLYRDGALEVAHGDTPVRRGDILLAVGRRADVDAFSAAVGSDCDKDLHMVPSRIIQARVIVTHRAVIGRTLEELGLEKRYDVAVTRVSRADVEFLVPAGYVLQFADNLVVVGEEVSVNAVSALLGNSPRDLNQPRLIPVFLAIGLGVLLGSALPFLARGHVPGNPLDAGRAAVLEREPAYDLQRDPAALLGDGGQLVAGPGKPGQLLRNHIPGALGVLGNQQSGHVHAQ